MSRASKKLRFILYLSRVATPQCFKARARSIFFAGEPRFLSDIFSVKKFASKEGFTLVEILVAIAVFSIATSIAVGSFTRILKSQRQTASLIAANSNASLTIEQIAREIRTGKNFCRGNSCPSPDFLSFVNARDQNVVYCLAEEAVWKGVDAREGCGGRSFQKVTSDNVRVVYLNFRLFGHREGDGFPPRVTIIMGVSSPEAGVSGTVYNFQTTVSARIPDT